MSGADSAMTDIAIRVENLSETVYDFELRKGYLTAEHAETAEIL